MLNKKHLLSTSLLTLAAVFALTHLSIGPSHAAEEASWAAVKQAVVYQAPDGTTYVAFSPEALTRVAKKVKKPPGNPPAERTISNVIGVEGPSRHRHRKGRSSPASNSDGHQGVVLQPAHATDCGLTQNYPWSAEN